MRTNQGTHADRASWRVAWWRDDRGSVAAEIALITPLLIMLLVFVAVVIHRGVDARLRLDDAAHQAARAASQQRNARAAVTAAQSTARSALSNAGVVCRSVQVTTDTAGLVPGGTVTVNVTCGVQFGDTLIFGQAHQRVVSSTASEPVDTWRAVETSTGSGS